MGPIRLWPLLYQVVTGCDHALVLLIMIECDGPELGGIVLSLGVECGTMFIDVLDGLCKLFTLHCSFSGDEMLLSNRQRAKRQKEEEGSEQRFHRFIDDRGWAACVV